MATVYLGLGTNLGDRAANLRRALNALAPHFSVDAVSACYETEPAYVQDQPRFYNLAARATTQLPPLEALHVLKQLETQLGRQAGVRYGPRLIDIDLLLYDDVVLASPELTLPHPRLPERAFVLVPLTEIAPDLVHPRLGLTMTQLRDRLGDVSKLIWPVPDALAARPRMLTLGNTTLEWGKQTYVMGIVNVTPDSFSGDGLLQRDDWIAAAVAQGEAQVAAGAHLLDVGGESTRPGSTPTPLDEELRRVIPVIRELAQRVSVPISVDTYKAEVARQAAAAGATLINDVWGFRMDPEMGRVAAESGAAVVLMHNRSKPKDAVQEARLGGRYVGVQYENLIEDIKRELLESVAIAQAAGVASERILLDPGLGFGKTVEQNLEIVRRLGEFRALGYPLLVGPSRKSFIGYTLDLPADQRAEGTAAIVALCIQQGADIVRVHDVALMSRVARMTDAVVRPTTVA